MQLERMTFFSDAVFAIAITLLVIEIRLPHHITSDAQLAQALLELTPSYIGFIISFFVIGRFWIGHHRAMGQLSSVDAGLIWRNLILLLTIAFMPFPTAVISEYTITRSAVGFYTGWLTIAGIANFALMSHALKTPALLDPEGDISVREKVLAGRYTPLIIGISAFAVGMVQPVLALVPLLAGSALIGLFGRIKAHRAQKAAAIKAAADSSNPPPAQG